MQEDPDPGRVSSPMSVHDKYIYAGNSPTNNIDPLGLDFWSKNFSSVTNFYARNKKEINAAAMATLIVGGAVLAAPAVGLTAAGVLTSAAIAGSVGAAFTAMSGGSTGDIITGFFGGAAAGAIGAIGIGAGVTWLGGGATMNAIGGAIGGAAGGLIGVNANAIITRGELATGPENGFGLLGGAVGGMIAGAVWAGVGNLGKGVAGATGDSVSASTSSAVSPPSSGQGYVVFNPN